MGRDQVDSISEQGREGIFLLPYSCQETCLFQLLHEMIDGGFEAQSSLVLLLLLLGHGCCGCSLLTLETFPAGSSWNRFCKAMKALMSAENISAVPALAESNY